MKRVAVFASGSGSNFQAIKEAEESYQVYQVVVLICDRQDAYAIKRAEAFNIPVHVFSIRDYESKREYELAIKSVLSEYEVDWVALAGYMRLVGPTLLEAYANRMLNLHPSLLPKFPGKNAIEQALDAGEKQTGATVHIIDEGMDTGPVITQESVEIVPGETVSSLQEKIQRIEHQLYPQTLADVIRKGEQHDQ
ncbi:phosphoribosylglycinamide formyltransferase [Halalkalibacillus halophilus]|uniref:phosphoribosylglycinamide formyltransferase n=1 Tax=Halalkalibacillus halophilus TaxID=392827 RepID=UPI0003FA0E45|nr:phosphoribosylglycinamide formyltransferase [Halalkalibacillus halophilus]